MASNEVIVHELGILEGRELKKLLRGEGRLQESDPLSAGQQGDAALLALAIQATPWAAGVVGLWLLKPRKGKTLRKTLTSTDEKGKVYREEIYIHEASSDSPSEAVVKALSKLFGFQKEIVEDAIKQVQSQIENDHSSSV
jgi:hypothetical protein